MYKIGIGYDVHPLMVGRKLILGGAEIPFERGLSGHSDADVLLHAIMDAILGALGDKDIGLHFPSSDPLLKGASSVKMLEKVREIMNAHGFRIVNIDSVIIADEPPLSRYYDAMKDKISSALGIEKDLINIKGKRTEGLGFEGRGEGVAAQAIALLQKGA